MASAPHCVTTIASLLSRVSTSAKMTKNLIDPSSRNFCNSSDLIGKSAFRIPPIFASSILLFPASLGQWFGQGEGMEWLSDISQALAPSQPLYIILFAAAVVFFCFFYTALMYNPKEVADNLKRSGAFIPGIRPGEQTSKYIDGVLTRLTLFGAMYITAVSLFPQFLMVAGNVPFYLGGTSLLIVVVVVMDFMAQVQSHLMSHQYESLMKKSNLKGYGRNG